MKIQRLPCLLPLVASGHGLQEGVTMLQVRDTKSIEIAGNQRSTKMEAALAAHAKELQFVESLASSLVASGSKIDEAAKTALEAIKSTLDNSLQLMAAAHTTDQGLLDNIHTRATGCGTTYTSSKATDAASKTSVETKVTEHATCRTNLATSITDRNTKCDALTTFMNGLSPPTCTVPDSAASMESYWTDYLAYHTNNFATWQTKDSQCTAATNTETTSESECDSQQQALESDYCTLRDAMLTSCSIYTSCHNLASSDFADTESAVTANQDRRKIEAAAVDIIKCYVDVILSTETITEDDLTTCKNLEPDTSSLDLTIPTIPALQSCVLPAVDDVPCSCGFLKKYTDMVRLDACVQCGPVPSSLASVDPGTLTGLPCGTPTPTPPPPPLVVLVPDSGSCESNNKPYADWGCAGKPDGIHTLQLPDGGDDIEVACADGWIILHQRVSNSDFYKGWEEYAAGFGDDSNHWVGLRSWHRLTAANGAELRIVLQHEQKVGFGEWSDFKIGSESDKFPLALGSYCSSSTVGDALTGHAGHKFTTKDSDNDISNLNCAEYYTGAWWYNSCHHSNLNGDYDGNANYAGSNNWQDFTGFSYKNLDKSFMMIKPYAA